MAPEGVGKVFVEPALDYLARARRRRFASSMACTASNSPRGGWRGSCSATARVELGPDDAVILAVPAYAAAAFVPGLQTPTAHRGIVNAHFRFDPPADAPPMLGVINGTSEWIFSFPGRIAVTISDAARLFDMPRAELAQDDLARGGARRCGCRRRCRPGRSCASGAPPSRRRRRRTPSGRGPRTQWRNLILAGDWTDTGLPATIESAVRSGNRAADRHRRRRRGRRHERASPCSRGRRRPPAIISTRRWARPRARCFACQRDDGHWVFELEADATIPAEYVLLTHYRGEDRRRRAGAQDRRLSAPHPGRAWRLAAVHRRRLRHERQREGLFRAEDDRRRYRRAAHEARARGDPLARRRHQQQRVHARAACRCSASCAGKACR